MYHMAVTEEPEGGFSAYCIELPAAITQGETRDELRKNMQEAIQLVREYIAEEIENGKLIIEELQV